MREVTRRGDAIVGGGGGGGGNHQGDVIGGGGGELGWDMSVDKEVGISCFGFDFLV